MNPETPPVGPGWPIVTLAARVKIGVGILVAALTFHGAASAQESGHQWKFFDTPYNTQQEAEAAIRAIGNGYEYVRVVRDRRISEDKIELVYGIPHEIGALRDWHAYSSGNAGVTASEQAYLAAIRTYYDNKSISVGCTPNTTATLDRNWRGIRFWSDGVAYQEMADYKLRYVSKAIGGTTCGTFSSNESVLRDRRRCSNEHLTWETGDVCKNDVY